MQVEIEVNKIDFVQVDSSAVFRVDWTNLIGLDHTIGVKG